MGSSIGSISGVSTISPPSPTSTADAIAQARQTMLDSTLSFYTSSTTTPDAGIYSYQSIYDSSFLNAISRSNGEVAATGNGTTILPFGDTNAAIESATNGMQRSVDSIYASVTSLLSQEWGAPSKTPRWDMSSMVLGSIYARAGYDPKTTRF